ncbi:hypothetical protein Leryth_005497 [Lithospermum erythrorhizon]|nr:hypothetical protein Leryth_005497 [Lithospermum erythrorhizon]
MQLKYKTGFGSSHDHDLGQEFGKNARSKECLDGDFENLESSFKELGHIMMEIGVHLAKICDRVIGFHELEDSLLESCTAKGRLIHYHSGVDNSIIRASLQKPKLSRQKNDPNGLANGIKLIASKQCGNSSNLWQQWHYDYGIFTVLTAPMFMLGNYPEVESGDNSSCIPSAQKYKSPSGHTCLQIFHPEKNCTLMVKASPESFIVQVGEAADVLSKGKLRATLHSVCRPAKPENLSRETFVVFLQPSWKVVKALLFGMFMLSPLLFCLVTSSTTTSQALSGSLILMCTLDVDDELMMLGDFLSTKKSQNKYYGFRKIDPDKWEFANEAFLRGQKHLLKTIKRRKTQNLPQVFPPLQQQEAPNPFPEVGRVGLNAEIDRLRRDKQGLMMELVKLRHHQQSTKSHLQAMELRLQGTEKKQQQMMNFLAKAMQKPEFIHQLVQQKDKRKELEEDFSKKRRRAIDQGPSGEGSNPIKLEPMEYGNYPYVYDQVSELETLALEMQGIGRGMRRENEDVGQELDEGFWEDLFSEGFEELLAVAGNESGEEEEDVNVLADKLRFLDSCPK